MSRVIALVTIKAAPTVILAKKINGFEMSFCNVKHPRVKISLLANRRYPRRGTELPQAGCSTLLCSVSATSPALFHPRNGTVWWHGQRHIASWPAGWHTGRQPFTPDEGETAWEDAWRGAFCSTELICFQKLLILVTAAALSQLERPTPPRQLSDQRTQSYYHDKGFSLCLAFLSDDV